MTGKDALRWYLQSPEVKQRTYELGRYYGYPDCCIEAFHGLVGIEDMTKEQRAAAGNSGFIPCQTHAVQVLAGKPLEDLILPTRKEPRPFPRGSG